MGQAIIGLNKANITLGTDVPNFRLGTIGGYDDPVLGYQEFVYGKANGALSGLGYACLESTGFLFSLASVTNSAPGSSGPGSRVGICQAFMSNTYYGWFQIYGKGSLRVASLAAKGTRLNTTGTNGVLDDDGTASSEQIMGAVLMTANGGAEATSADAMFTYPVVGITL